LHNTTQAGNIKKQEKYIFDSSQMCDSWLVMDIFYRLRKDQIGRERFFFWLTFSSWKVVSIGINRSCLEMVPTFINYLFKDII